MAVFYIKMEAETAPGKKKYVLIFFTRYIYLRNWSSFPVICASQFSEDILSVFCIEKLFRIGRLKNPSAMRETCVGKILWRREGLPTPVFWPREFHGQRSLEGYSPWGLKEWDMTEQLSLSLFTLEWEFPLSLTISLD